MKGEVCNKEEHQYQKKLQKWERKQPSLVPGIPTCLSCVSVYTGRRGEGSLIERTTLRTYLVVSAQSIKVLNVCEMKNIPLLQRTRAWNVFFRSETPPPSLSTWVDITLASYPGHMGEGKSGLVSTVWACANDSWNLPRMSPIIGKLHVVVMRRITKLDIWLGMWQLCLCGDNFHILSETQGVTLQLPPVPLSLFL